ncbi:hypothetical protein V6N13_080673 [Hibiscus sabdariffa]
MSSSEAKLKPSSSELDLDRPNIEDYLPSGASIHEPHGKLRLRDLLDISPILTEAAGAIVDDSFTRCFKSNPPEPWNWNVYLFPLWCSGVVFRYLILFPVRALVLTIGWIIFLSFFIPVHFLLKGNDSLRKKWERVLVELICSFFVASWTGVVKYHGPRPSMRPKQVFVANHTSMIDFIILEQMTAFAVIMQKHPGWVGLLQSTILESVGCIWFNRSEAKDREIVAKKLREHSQGADNNPLLIFPEGTCVNNQYSVMFKKGAFELGCTVCPVAIKYNKIFVDAFWNSRKQSFTVHLLQLMTSWAVVCDVWYLEPQNLRPGETAIEFAERVRDIISVRAGLKKVPWDGYLKYSRPSPKHRERKKELSYKNGERICYTSAVHRNSLLSPLLGHGNRRSPALRSQLGSGFGVEDAGERLTLNEEENTAPLSVISTENVDVHEVTGTSVDVKRELIMLSLPAIAGQAIDPFALLMETAYIGRYSSVALASAGVSVSIFNVVSKLFNIPLSSVATSFVAEDISRNAIENLSAAESTNGKTVERKQLSSVSTALVLAILIGSFEALALSLGSGLFLKLMGVPSTSDMHVPAKHFLLLRALGAPAMAVSLALQGIFRGFKDTQTPVFCLGVGNVLSIFFFPILMYGLRMGLTGAALSTVLSQYIVAFLMLRYLNKKVVLMPPKMGGLQFGSYIKSGGFLIGRTISVLITITLATSMAARQGSLPMAAHQICMQVWLAVSLLTDALATSGQALIASYLSKGELQTVKEVANFVLKIGVVAGVLLATILGVSFSSLATLFTQDAEVLAIVRTGVLFVSASQPINALAFIFDGLHYGVSDFPYVAGSMMLVSAVSSALLLFVPKQDFSEYSRKPGLGGSYTRTWRELERLIEKCCYPSVSHLRGYCG